MTDRKQAGKRLSFFPAVAAAALISMLIAPVSPAQSNLKPVNVAPNDAAAAKPGAPKPGAADDPYFRSIYHNFYETYRLGPEDALALRIYGQPDYSFDKVVVSPVGR